MIYPNYLSCFKVVPEPGQRNSFSKRLFVPQNTAYGMLNPLWSVDLLDDTPVGKISVCLLSL